MKKVKSWDVFIFEPLVCKSVCESSLIMKAGCVSVCVCLCVVEVQNENCQMKTMLRQYEGFVSNEHLKTPDLIAANQLEASELVCFDWLNLLQ